MFKPTRSLAVVVVAIGALAATTIYGDPADENKEPTTSELLKRIEALEARISLLEGRAIVPRFTRPLARQAAPAPLLEPKYWTKKEFNGRYYYIVPLNKSERPSVGSAAEPR